MALTSPAPLPRPGPKMNKMAGESKLEFWPSSERGGPEPSCQRPSVCRWGHREREGQGGDQSALRGKPSAASPGSGWRGSPTLAQVGKRGETHFVRKVLMQFQSSSAKQEGSRSC